MSEGKLDRPMGSIGKQLSYEAWSTLLASFPRSPSLRLMESVQILPAFHTGLYPLFRLLYILA